MITLHRMMYLLAKQQREYGMSTRHGYVHDVQQAGGERKIRVVMGIKADGTPWLSPWLHSEEQRGGTQEQHLVEKGQNVIITNHGGDFRNATFSHGGESQSFPQPSQAPNVNGYSSEHGKLRTSYNKPSSNGGGGGSGGGTSLLGTTEVFVPSGMKSIQDIQLGDKIFSCPISSAARKPVEDTVIGIHTALTKKQVYILAYEGGQLCCTDDHGIWAETRGNYVSSGLLGFVDKLRTHDSIVAIRSLVPLEIKEQKVFDLTVATNGNFYVRDGNTGVPILVHNQAGGGGGGGGGGSGGGSDHFHTVEIMDQAPNNPQHQEQTGQPEQGGGNGGQQQGGGGQSQATAVMTQRVSESGYLTGRVGNDDNAARYAAHAKGAKIRMKNNAIFCINSGCYSSKPIQLMPDNVIPNDNS